MREIFLNYDKLRDAQIEYYRIKGLRDEWIAANADLLGIVDLSNFGSWRDMYDFQNKSINTDIADFCQDITTMCTTLDEADTQCCRLLNRADDFYELLDGSANVVLYPPTLCTGSIKNLFYDSAYYSEILNKCSDVIVQDELEHTQINLINDYIDQLEYVPASDLASYVNAVETAIEKQKYIEDFKDSFDLYAQGVATFNDIIGTALSALVEDIESIPVVTRDYTFPMLGLTQEQQSKIWWAEFIDDCEKDYYVDVPKSDTYIKQVYELYHNSQSGAKALFDQYRGKIKVASMEVPIDKASHHCGGYLYINLNRDVNDPRGNGVTFYHETGHFIVYSTGARKSQEMKDFDAALKKDVTAYIESKEAEAKKELQQAGKSPSDSGYQTKFEDLVKQKIKADIEAEFGKNVDSALYDGITDMIDAASNHKYVVGYNHTGSDPNYWWTWNDPTYWEEDPDRQSDEAFAEMFAADMQEDQKELDFIKKHFGTVYDEYEDLRDYMITQGEK